MKEFKWAFSALLFAVFLSSPVQAQEIIVYPAKGQSNDQMEKDKFECYNWAKGQTGFDPMQMPTASSFCRAPKTVMKRCATASAGPWPFQRKAARWC
jgi:hypothetical protein